MTHEVLDHDVRPICLKTADDSGLITTASRTPAFTWHLSAERGNVRQIAYEVQACRDRGFARDVFGSGRIEDHASTGAPWPGDPLTSRQQMWCRARSWTDRGVTAWSDALCIEAPLFDPDDWVARPVSPVGNIDRVDPVPVPLLRRAFVARKGISKARLYVTALGIHELWLNGQPVGDALFDPGWTVYADRHLYSVYDVTALLSTGENVIAAAVGDGWWRGNLTWMMRRAVYGATTALLAQLEITYADGSSDTIATDETWRGSTGAVREADFYHGCAVDLAYDQPGWRTAGFDDSDWTAVATLPLPNGLEQRAMPPVRIVKRFPVALKRGQNGLHMIDCGQNLTGWLRLRGKADTPTTIVVRHAEVLEPDGALHTAALRNARATDIYHVLAGAFDLAPSFTCHGFRFAEIECAADVVVELVEARVVSSDLREIGSFRCSDARLNQLDANIRWSQRGNFIALPTDCPQRDERLGWTGDIQVFGPTACANFESRAFLESWLMDLALDQAVDGQVTSTVPNVIQGHPYEFAGIGWADAATLLPWAVFEAYGDPGVLKRQFASMKRWVDWGASRLDADGVWTGDFHLGDWLDPGAPPDKPEQATTDRDFIASAYLAKSARIVSRAAEILGDVVAVERYREIGEAVAAATWRKWRDIAPLTQTGAAMAIAFDIAPAKARADVGIALAALVERQGGRIATGFLGTPLVLPALTATGQHEAAYRLLLNNEAPGWLYQVRNGATTMWERWDAILSDGSINAGPMAVDDAASMISFNHYAYGAVGAWMYRTLAGIAPDDRDPGYGTIRFAPQPGGEITWAEAAIDTPYGPARIRWALTDREFAVMLEVPPGARGVFVVPDGWLASDGSTQTEIGSGVHHFGLSAA